MATAAGAQGFGRNQVKNRDFKWKVVSTDHFNIHYYEDGEPLVPFAVRILERSYERLSKALDVSWGKDKRKPFFLYASLSDMQRSRIVAVGDGTGGVTEAFKNRFIVFNDGSRSWLDTVTTHELTHVFQFHILIEGWWRSARILKTIVYPLWMMEGMAEYFSWGLDDTAGEVLVRDAAVSDGLIKLYKLEHFSHLKPHQVRLAYESGEKLLGFLDSEFGPGTVRRMIKLFESRFESSAVLTEITGLDIFKLDKKWREYAKEKYDRIVTREKLKEPDVYGKRLTPLPKGIPEQNSSPVISADGKKVFYLTTRYGFPASIVERDLKTGKERKLISHDTAVESVHVGNFTNKSRSLSLSPDGRWLAFAGTKNHRDSIYLYDLEHRKKKRLDVPGFQAVNQPAFSPDGRFLAFSGMKGARTDIYVYERASGNVSQLTDDAQDDQTPAYSPDGRSVIYSSEFEDDGGKMLYQRRLYRVGVDGGAVEELSTLPGAARDPVVSADGKRVLFALEGGGFYEAYELDLKTRETTRLTRSIGAVYTPTYGPKGDLFFAGFRKGSIHLFRGDRSGFEGALDAVGLADGYGSVGPVGTSTVTADSGGREASSPFSTDLFLPAFFYSSSGGLFWSSFWQASDLLGRHQVISILSYGSGAGFLDYAGQYGFNGWRTNLRAGVVGRLRENSFDQSTGLTSDESTHVQFAGASYPFDRFHRAELTVTSASGHLRFDNIEARVRREARSASVALVRDTVRGRYLVATSGNRVRLSASTHADVFGNNVDRELYSLNAIQYFPLGQMSSLVLRGFGLHQEGRDSAQFILGGIGGLRGYGRSTVRDLGRSGGIGTAELRFPLWANMDYYMWYVFPDFYFKAISAAVFTDVGHVWDTQGQLEVSRLNNLRHSYGVGLRIHTFILQLFPLVIHFDYAKRTTSSGDGIFYVYLGPLF
ncbi:MAG: hypothetical protein COB53_09125 [Elusimicrobia bacterium]|nr:MAG: hypothetical protein COB53_09125 [Elusimicrobiota bacterium]